jgi:hypothetical protein
VSEAVTVVNGPTQSVTVGGGGTVQNVSVSPAQTLQVVVNQSQQQSLASMVDVALTTPNNGDLLRYSSNKWRNTPEGDLILDGQNF